MRLHSEWRPLANETGGLELTLRQVVELIGVRISWRGSKTAKLNAIVEIIRRRAHLIGKWAPTNALLIGIHRNFS